MDYNGPKNGMALVELDIYILTKVFESLYTVAGIGQSIGKESCRLYFIMHEPRTPKTPVQPLIFEDAGSLVITINIMLDHLVLRNCVCFK